MTGGEMHGPDRIFDMHVAFNDDGVINSLAIVAIDDAGANSSRGPLQLIGTVRGARFWTITDQHCHRGQR